MKKILTALFLLILLSAPASASILDLALGMSTLFFGINTLANTYSTVNQVKMMNTMNQNMQMQNAVYGQNMQANGYQDYYTFQRQQKAERQVTKLEDKVRLREAKTYLKLEQDKAKADNDVEKIEYIKAVWLSNNRNAVFLAEEKVKEFNKNREDSANNSSKK